jgi:hypothetical protein
VFGAAAGKAFCFARPSLSPVKGGTCETECPERGALSNDVRERSSPLL